jgi:hypothetical protein
VPAGSERASSYGRPHYLRSGVTPSSQRAWRAVSHEPWVGHGAGIPGPPREPFSVSAQHLDGPAKCTVPIPSLRPEAKPSTALTLQAEVVDQARQRQRQAVQIAAWLATGRTEVKERGAGSLRQGAAHDSEALSLSSLECHVHGIGFVGWLHLECPRGIAILGVPEHQVSFPSWVPRPLVGRCTEAAWTVDSLMGIFIVPSRTLDVRYPLPFMRVIEQTVAPSNGESRCDRRVV